jgi:hypothetical protein
MELRFSYAQDGVSVLNITHRQTHQFTQTQTTGVKQHDGKAQCQRPQRRAGRFRKLGCDAEHVGDLPRFEDYGRDIGLELGSAFSGRKKAAGLAAPSIDTEETHDLIPFAPRIGMVVLETCQPTFKAFGIEIAATALFDVSLEHL